MSEITFDSFVKTLEKLVTANAHAKSKGDAFKQWCKDNFNLNSRIGFITSQQQTTNRVSEQFRYFDPVVLFVCNTDVKRESLHQYILERVYRQLENVAVIGVTSSGEGEAKTYEFTYETLFIFKPNQFTEWIQDNFSSVEDGKELLKQLLGSAESSKYDGSIEPVIYYGAPGTGKTHFVQKELYDKYSETCRLFTTFHQSYSYEDFVEGLKPVLDSENSEITYHIESGVFYNACEKAAILAGYDNLEDCLADTPKGRSDKFFAALMAKKSVLLCIDEINRGNVASIFGDLISLIETSKRLGAGENELILTLPYSKMPFGVPANLFIVGTMNTADRSIQLLDSALRRRFRFEELTPNYEVIKNDNAKFILQRINSRIRCLLNKDNQIGHAYLINEDTNCGILTAIYHKIIPLLEEYFYEDMDKVRFVLNEKDECFYITDTEAKKAYESFLINDIEEEDREFYMLNPKIAKAIESKDEDECLKYLVNLLS